MRKSIILYLLLALLIIVWGCGKSGEEQPTDKPKTEDKEEETDMTLWYGLIILIILILLVLGMLAGRKKKPEPKKPEPKKPNNNPGKKTTTNKKK